jgi:hypothetical protein
MFFHLTVAQGSHHPSATVITFAPREMSITRHTPRDILFLPVSAGSEYLEPRTEVYVFPPHGSSRFTPPVCHGVHLRAPGDVDHSTSSTGHGVPSHVCHEVTPSTHGRCRSLDFLHGSWCPFPRLPRRDTFDPREMSITRLPPRVMVFQPVFATGCTFEPREMSITRLPPRVMEVTPSTHGRCRSLDFLHHRSYLRGCSTSMDHHGKINRTHYVVNA